MKCCKVIGVANRLGDIIVIKLDDFYEGVGPMDQMLAIEFGYVDE